MDQANKNKFQILHSLLDKELYIIQQQLNTDTDQGHLFKNSYLQRIKEAEQSSNKFNHKEDYELLYQMNMNQQGIDTSNNTQYCLQDNKEYENIRTAEINANHDEQNRKNYLGYYNNNDSNFQAMARKNPNPLNYSNQNDTQDINHNKQKQTFITDYGSQISFQQRTSQHNSHQQTDALDTEGQQINFTKFEDDINDPFANVNLQKEISGLQQKIQYLESKFNQSENESSSNSKKEKQISNRVLGQVEQNVMRGQNYPQNTQIYQNDQNINNKEGRLAIKNQNQLQNENNSFQPNNQKSNSSNFIETLKNPQESSHLRVDEYLNTQETFKRENKHQRSTLSTILEQTQSSKDKKEKQKNVLNYSSRNDNSSVQSKSKSPQNIGNRRSISSKSSRIIYQNQDNSFGGLEKEIEGAEQRLDISKRSLKQTLSSRLNLKTDSNFNRSNYSQRQQVSQNGLSKRSGSQKSQRERSISQGNPQNIFFPIDNYAQQYHESVELKQKIAAIRKQYEIEKEILNEEREKNKMINEDIDRIQIKVKKISMLIEKNQQNEKDYYKLLESYNKSEQIRKQQKQLVIQLKEEIEQLKSNPTRSPIMVYDNNASSKRRNSKRLSTSSSQKYPKKF